MEGERNGLPNRVRKRDGREERMDSVRLTDSIRHALQGVGADSSAASYLAEEVAGSILCDGTVETAGLAASAETVLVAAGRSDAADAYREFRQHCLKHFQRVRVHTSHGRDDTARPWDRRRLAISLMRDRNLENALAWQVARRVERRVYGTALRHLTGRLVAGLADNECRTLGLRADSLEAERVGLERRQLSAWLGGGSLPTADGGPALAGPGHDPRHHLGGQLLSRFALQDLLSGAQSDAILDGRFELPTLVDWTRPARILLRPVAGESEEAFWRRVGEELGRAHEVQVHWPASRNWSSLSLRAPRWIQRPDSRLRLYCTDAELAREWALDGLWVRLSLDSFVRAAPELRATLADSGRVLVCWWPDRENLRQHRGIERVYGAVVLNLAGPAQLAKDPKDFFDRIGEAAGLACGAVALLADRSASRAPFAVSIQPAGLPQALQWLYGPSRNPTDSSSRTILAIFDRFHQAARNYGLGLRTFAPPHPEGAGARLALRDHATESGAYPVGWCPVEATPAPPPSAFAAAPWLQFSASAALHHDFRRWVSTPASSSDEPPTFR
ncbi:MAG TPA: hypothetical protein QGG59_09150 [Planctomycetota bacterium]|jgi:hypothetical protein|nr:hypothetical protein [Planctomycetota bacterium]MDP6129768.1 hypothetical protein [Planctomycetota bacterium]MDP7245307.1 hypothetical protein [Planctomycetota bacterium]HJM40268.1 hypothetical protein [Planctomycetota bacterium]